MVLLLALAARAGLDRAPRLSAGSGDRAAPAARAGAGGRSGLIARAELHHPPRRLRRADPDRGQPLHLLPVLHRQHARRHGAHEHRRQAGDAGADREVEGRARLRQAAATGTRSEEGAAQASPTPSSSSSRCRCSRSTSAAPTRARASTSATRSARACGSSLQLAHAGVHPAGAREHARSRCCSAFFRHTYLDFWGVVLCVADDVDLERCSTSSAASIFFSQAAAPGADLGLCRPGSTR